MKKYTVVHFITCLIVLSAILLECTSGRSFVSIILNCIFYLILLWVSVSDIHTMTIPDSCHVLILLLGLFSLLYDPSQWKLQIIGFFCISLPLLLLAVITGGFGGGDIKLCAACGFYLGAPLVLFGSLTGTILAAFFSIPLILFHKLGKQDSICFGPFLSLGFICSSLSGQVILDSYLLLFQ